ncbi:MULTISPECIES: MFS transporter [unclassified Haladaptatus]|uniref:MFS transporter n=1 Tax=unclassified Haladaptatus TaxID=2622732 RepID=UPI0023E7E1F5|nr:MULTISPECIES: MFS transporter [unclassified Haladaptatus]
MNWRYQHTLLAATFLACFSNNAARLVISPVIPDIIVTFDISKSAVGLALTGMWAVYALLQFPSGIIADRIGDYKVILAALGLTGLASALLAFSPSFTLFAVFAVFLGAGAGLYFTVGTSMLAKEFTETGKVLGVHSAAGPAAGLVAPAVAAYIGVAYGWRPSILLGAVLSVPILGVFLWRVRPVSTTPDAAPRTRTDGGTTNLDQSLWVLARDLLSRPDVVFMTLLGVCVAYTWQSFASFFPTFLVEYRGFSVPDASLVFGAIFLLSALVQPVTGRLSDRIRRETILAGILTTTVAGFGTLILTEGVWPTFVGVGLLGVGLSWGGVYQSSLMDLFADATRGTAFGLVRTVYMFIGSLGSVVTGVLADTVGWSVAYGVVALLLALAVGGLTAKRVITNR